MNFAAFFSYIFLTAFTPGPNNIMSMSLAGSRGFRRTLRFCLGVFLAHIIIGFCAAAFSALLYSFIPRIERPLVYAGAAYILWLAWSIYRDKPSEKKEKKTRFEAGSTLSGLVLQFINVKGIIFWLTAMSTFILPHYKSIPVIALFVLILCAVIFSSTVCWAAFGAVFEKLFAKRRRVLNIIMALLLVYCAVVLILG